MRVQKWHCYLQLLPLQLVQLVLACCSCAVRVRQCRLCIPGLKRTACGDPLSWTQPDLVIPGRPDRKGAVAPDVWCTASHFKSENKKKGSENTKSRSKFEVTVTWMDEIFDSKRIQAMRIHITSYHYEPFKGPDGLLSPRMVSSSAFHLRPDCQCLTEKTTPPSTAFAGGVFCHTVIKSGDSTRSWRYFWTSRKASASSSCSPDSQG